MKDDKEKMNRAEKKGGRNLMRYRNEVQNCYWFCRGSRSWA